MSVSHTTRSRRPTEEHGREYYFIGVPEFERLVAEGQFLEHARVFDNLYGTARAPVETRLAEGGDIVLEIDWQGARQVRSAMPDCVTIFILPPSREALEKRLQSRATDSPEVIARRLRDAVSDMSHWREFDYVVVNDDFEKAVADLVSIVAAHGETAPSNAGGGGAGSPAPDSSGGAQRLASASATRRGGAGNLAATRPELAPLLERLLA
jgi:guanylate kinase